MSAGDLKQHEAAMRMLGFDQLPPAVRAYLTQAAFAPPMLEIWQAVTAGYREAVIVDWLRRWNEGNLAASHDAQRDGSWFEINARRWG